MPANPAAVGLLREALAAHETAYGPDHPSVAFVLVALSDVADDPAKARRAIARATLIRLRSLGPKLALRSTRCARLFAGSRRTKPARRSRR